MTQNFTNSLSQGFAKMKDKAAVLQQSLKVKSRLSALATQKTALLAQLGDYALHAYRSGQPVVDEAFAQQANNIALLEQEVAALEQELAMLEGRAPAPAPMQGPACGACGAPLAPGAAFCGNCGTRTAG